MPADHTCAHRPHPRIDRQRRTRRWADDVVLSSHGRYRRRSHHRRRPEMSTAILRDDVISACRDGVEFVGVVEVACWRGAEGRRGRVGGRLTARRVVEARVRRRSLDAGRLRVERTVRRKAETCRLLLLQLTLVTV